MLAAMHPKRRVRNIERQLAALKKPYWTLRAEMSDLASFGLEGSKAYKKLASQETSYRVEARRYTDDVEMARRNRLALVRHYLQVVRPGRLKREIAEQKAEAEKIVDPVAETIDVYMGWRQETKVPRKKTMPKNRIPAYSFSSDGLDSVVEGVLDFNDEFDALEQIERHGTLVCGY